MGPAGKETVPIFLGWVGVGSRDLLDRDKTHKISCYFGTCIFRFKCDSYGHESV